MLGKFQMLNARVLQVAFLMSVLAPISIFLVACGGGAEPEATAAPAPTLEAVTDEVFELKFKSGGPTRQ